MLIYYFFYKGLQVSDCLVFLCLIDKEHVSPRISLTNVAALNYLLRSHTFVNNDGQLRAAHLILDYEPISRTFQDVGNAIKANDYRLARIDMSWSHLLAPHDIPPVDHPIPQGIPLAAQLVQQVPLGLAVAEEGVASSSSLEEEIDKFQFEEEETQGVEAIIISEVEEETNVYSCIQTPASIITYVEDSSDNEAEEMAPKSGQSLKELMKRRNKAPTPQEANKSKPLVNPPPPPPQLPADLGLKPNPKLRRKRQHETPEEGEIGPSKGNKQQRVSQDHRSRRSTSVESREDPLAAHVHRTSCTWIEVSVEH